MSLTVNINKNPFTQLDSYNDEAFAWAQEEVNKIDINRFNEKDIQTISISFAYIFIVSVMTFVTKPLQNKPDTFLPQSSFCHF